MKSDFGLISESDFRSRNVKKNNEKMMCNTLKEEYFISFFSISWTNNKTLIGVENLEIMFSNSVFDEANFENWNEI